jgi:hypothetical protein
MRLSTESFRGETPRMTPRGLPDNASQDATNARLLTGDVTAWRQFREEKVLAMSPVVRTIWKMTDGVWLAFNEEVDLARGIIPGDDTFRTYITGLDVPRFTNLAMATAGAEPYPVETRPLGVPGPDGAPTVAAGIDPTPTSFSIDVLDEGDKLSTDWTVNPPLNSGGRVALVTQNPATGNPLPCYMTHYDENRDPGQEAWAYRDFGVEGVSILTVSVEFFLENRAQACINIGNTLQGSGVRVWYNDGGLAISKGTAWGCIFNRADLAGVALSPVPAVGVWNSMHATVTTKENGQKTITAWVEDPAGTKLGEVTATGTFDDGDYCGFANGINDDAPDVYRTYYDNYHVQATGSTNYTPVNTATSYVYTFVNDLGEESAPSFASATILRPDGVAITVTTPTDVPTGTDPDYGITSKRIYRAATGATGAVFLFVAEIPLAQAEYVDTVPDTELGEPLESEDWALPPSDLRGILALPNGVMVGFRRNQLCLSAQNRPHAWPVRNRLTTDTDIVAIGNVDTTVVVGTESFPYVASGNDPAAYSMAKFEVPQACVAKRSVAYLTGIGVVFASPDGLLAVSGVGQIRNLTDSIFTRDQWQALKPETIVGVAHDDVYHFFYDNTELG